MSIFDGESKKMVAPKIPVGYKLAPDGNYYKELGKNKFQRLAR